jgi:uncharacterized protein (TIGR00106 family)
VLGGLLGVLAEFSIFPIGSGVSLSRYVARSIELIQRSGLPYKVNAMGTVVEGNYDEVMALIKECHMRMRKDTERVVTIIKIDDRKGKKGRLEGKVGSVQKKVGFKIKQ